MSGYCLKHYRRYKKHGDPSVVKSKKVTGVCKEDNCKSDIYSLGYCTKHYQRFKKFGDADYVIRNRDVPELCTIEDCKNKYYASGLCHKHYTRNRRYGNPHTKKKYANNTFDKCKVNSCKKTGSWRGYCQRHYYTWKRHGHPLAVVVKLPKVCRTEDCGGSAVEYGYCEKHRYSSEERRHHRRKRRALKKKAPISDLKMIDWKDSLRNFDNRCGYCGEKSKNMHQEHVIPLSKNGSHTKTNIIPACPRCNLSKHNKLMEDWYPYQPFYSVEREERILGWMNFKVENRRIKLKLF